MLWLFLATVLVGLASILLDFFKIIKVTDQQLKKLIIVGIIEGVIILVMVYISTLTATKELKVEDEIYHLGFIDENVYIKDYNGSYICKTSDGPYYACENPEIIETDSFEPNIIIRKENTIITQNYYMMRGILVFNNLCDEIGKNVDTHYSYIITVPKNSIKHFNKIMEE